MPGPALLSLLLLAALAPAARAQTPRTLELVVASTTDVHGRLRGWDYYGSGADSVRGLARAATVVDSLRTAHPGRLILVDAGDLLQGNPLAWLAARVDTVGPHPVIAAMNAMRYDAAAIGNHEFNYGLGVLRRALRQARFPFLAANLATIERGARPLVAPSVIVRRAGVRIGIVGATTPGAMVWDRENLAGRVRIGDMVPAVARAVRSVRTQGAQVVVVVMHSGLDGESSYDEAATGVAPENAAARVAREVAGIDLIVYGHSHREVADTTINGVMLQQPRQWATSVGVARLSLERTRAGWRVAARRGQVIPVAGRAEHPAVVAATARHHAATVAWVNQELGTTPVAWRADSSRVMDTPLIDFLNEVQRRHTGADLSVTSSFDLNASLDAGPITMAEVARLYPYDNTLRVIRISGRQLRAFLEHSATYYRTLGSPAASQSLVDPAVPGFNFDIVAGATYDIDLRQPAGARITRLEARGRPVVDTDSFTLAINNYRQGGGGGYSMLQGAPVLRDRQEEIRDLLIAEVRRRGVLRPEDYHVTNWRLLPDEAVARAWRDMRTLPFDRPTPPRPGAAATHLQRGRWLRILATNDFHGGLEPSDFGAEGVVRGGAASLATALRQARAECPPPTCTSLWLDGGDQWQGTPASSLTLGRPVTDFFNAHGLAAAALGNHEFDWSVDSMRARLKDNRFPVLAANMQYRDGRDVEWMPDDTLLVIGNMKVGVIGVISQETSRTVRAAYVAPYAFADPAPIVDRLARALRARGAEVVVVVGHVGAGCDRALTSCSGEVIELARALTERVDAIVAGHSHRGTATTVAGIPIVQAYQKGSGLGVIDLPLAAGDSVRIAVRNVRPDSIPPDPQVAAWVDSVTAPVRQRLGAVIATVAEPIRRGNGALADLVADAHREAGAADIGVMNRGGVRADLVPGPVSMAMVFTIQPFGNRLVRQEATGREILASLEGTFRSMASGLRMHFSGIRITVDSTRPPGSRIVAVETAPGVPLDPARRYRVVLNDFIAEGGDGFGTLPGAQEVLPVVDTDALIDYLRRAPQPVRAPRDPRVILQP